MILTLTPNPSIDRTISVPALARGAVQRATDTRLDAGGKGINVSRAVARNGGSTRAVLPIGGAHGQIMDHLLRQAGLPVTRVPIREDIRANVALVEPDGTTTKVNEPGPRLSREEVETLLAAVTHAVHSAPEGESRWVVGSGSLPPDVPTDVYARLTESVRAAGGRVAIDGSGAPLATAIAASPDLVKPNRAELGELVGANLRDLGSVVEAARGLTARGVGQVLVSLGRDGAVLVTGESVCYASARVERPLSTVAAGDCTLAGYLLAVEGGASVDDALVAAVAFGAAAVALPGSEVPSREQVAAIRVELDPEPDLSTPLDD